MEKIEVKHIKEVKASSEDVALINVLSESAYLEEHIPGSINIPLNGEDDFVQRVESIIPSKAHKIIVYCSNSSCSASENAAKQLDKAGFSYVMDFAGGIEEWKTAGEPTARKDVR